MTGSDNFKDGKINVNGAEIYYKSFGKGEPLIVLHGGPGFDHHHMLPFADLADEYNVIFYDQRGSGDSSGKVDSASITMDNFVEDLEALRKTLKLGKINLLGHSWGSSLAMFYGIKYPENLQSLILLSPVGISFEFMEQFGMNMQANSDMVDLEKMVHIQQSDEFINGDAEKVAEYWRLAVKPMFYDKSKVAEMDWTFGENSMKNQAAVGDLLMMNLGDYNIGDDLSVIKCPVMIMHGDKDPLPLDGAKKAHQSIPGSRLKILKNSGHFIFIESRENVMKEIRTFLSQL